MTFKQIVLIAFLVIFFSITFIVVDIFLNQNNRQLLKIVFLDVGQGDSIFIEAPNGYQILIDAGPNSDVVRSLSKFVHYYDRNIDLIIATHSDADHVAGFIDILNRFKVNFFGRNPLEDEDALNSEISKLINSSNTDLVFLTGGDEIILDEKEDIKLQIIWPPKDYKAEDNNDNSIIARLTYDQISFLLTGDASVEVEKILVKNFEKDTNNNFLKSQVFKLGHHGSNTSNHLDFLEKVSPEYAVISAAKDNKFGHPHSEVIKNLENLKTKILETSALGSIEFESDGKTVWLVD